MIELDEQRRLKRIARQQEIDFKDRDYDSDDDLKKAMMTYDDRLTFINKCDACVFRRSRTGPDAGPIKG